MGGGGADGGAASGRPSLLIGYLLLFLSSCFTSSGCFLFERSGSRPHLLSWCFFLVRASLCCTFSGVCAPGFRRVHAGWASIRLLVQAGSFEGAFMVCF